MNIIERYITKNDCYRNNQNKADSRYTTFQKRGPIGLMLHSVGCPQPSAKVFADGWNVSGKEVAVHAVLQADGTVYQCLPWNYRGWHAGGDANNTHIGVEMTEPAQIKYTSGANFTYSDKAAAKAHVEGCYKTAVDLFTMLCEKYHLDPMTAIVSHAEGAKKGIASNHADPEHLWKGLGLGYTMDTFRRAVADKLGKLPEEKPEEKHLYRVRKTWEDKGSQIGAYTNLEYAIAAATEGYCVYDDNGKQVYPAAADAPLLDDIESPSGGKTCTITLPVLRCGSSGGYVKTLQILINACYNAGLKVDGAFGTVTEQAVRAYQKARGLVVDGVVGKITWDKLLM